MFIHDLQAHVRYEIVQKEVGARSVAAPGNGSSAKREKFGRAVKLQ